MDPIDATSAATLWANLSPKEQKAISKRLNGLNQQEPKARPQKKAGQFELRGYCRCELSASDKEGFREYEGASDASATLDRLVKAVDSGYLFKLAPNGTGFQASFCAADTGHAWDGLVLVAHAGGALRAAQLLVYKHEHMMQGDWSLWMEGEGEDALR